MVGVDEGEDLDLGCGRERAGEEIDQPRPVGRVEGAVCDQIGEEARLVLGRFEEGVDALDQARDGDVGLVAQELDRIDRPHPQADAEHGAHGNQDQEAEADGERDREPHTAPARARLARPIQLVRIRAPLGQLRVPLRAARPDGRGETSIIAPRPWWLTTRLAICYNRAHAVVR